jgi:hypothetical protein
MSSAIDPSKPGSPVAYTADVRANFSAAKTEIEALQAAVAANPTAPVTVGPVEGDPTGGQITLLDAGKYLAVYTADTALVQSGEISINTGGSDNKSGVISVVTGSGPGGNTGESGQITIASGNGEVSGNASIFTGSGVTGTGYINLQTGTSTDAGAPSGDIFLTIGDPGAGGTRGAIKLYGNSVVQAGFAFTLAADPAAALQAATKQYVDARTPQQPYTLAAYAAGTLTASQMLLLHRFGTAVTFPTNFAATAAGGSSIAGSSANATGSTVLTVARCTAASDPTNPANFFNIGTITFGAGAHAATFATTLAGIFAAGDTLRIMGPATPDATLAGVHLTLVGNR